MPDRGVVYYATGKQYIQQAAISAKSVKKHTDLHVTLYADRGAESPYIDRVVETTPSGDPFYDRIDCFRQTPYEKTLYLDTDTYVTADISPALKILGRFDIVAAYDPCRDSTAEQLTFDTIEVDVPDAFPEFQCGVVGYQNTETVRAFFDDWQARYEPYREQNVLDQPHFREALYENRVAVGTLPSEYNVKINFGGFLYDEAKIIHYAGKRNRPFTGTGRPDEKISEEIGAELNRETQQSRAVMVDPEEGVRVEPTLELSLGYRIRRSVRERGVLGTARRAVEKGVLERW